MIKIEDPDFDILKIADSGQCFRLRQTAPGQFELTAYGRLLHLEGCAGGGVLHCTPEEYRALWRNYFDLDTDYREFRACVPAEDPFLFAAAEYGRGIRILNQDPWEMLVTFIISQRKNIPAIQRSVELLCARCGTPLPGGGFAFPDPGQVARLTMEALAECALGYRARYIAAAAVMVETGALDLERLRQADDQTLFDALLTVPGVGPKVANCVMLFGYHRLTGFPRDVWINRMIQREYGGLFPLERYAGFEGVIQQYIFYYARSRQYQSRSGACQ